MIDGIKNVLVTITEEGREEQTSALGFGLTLAHEANAHLTVQAAAARFHVPYSMINDFSQRLVSAENRRIASLAEHFAQTAKAEAEFSGVVCTIESPQLYSSGLIERFLSHARVNDIAILDAEPSRMEIDRDLIEAGLFDSGRPVLIVPPGRSTFLCRRVIVAWDGSASAARAVAGAMPFLKAAEAAEIVSVVGEKDLSKTAAGTDLAPNLSRHGINVSVSNTSVGPTEDVATAIQRAATGFEASMIVCGAYRRSRLREWLLGGVTESMLNNCRLPILMTH
ncbi:universal stress protein (plasmid) [Bosea sp. F3-2]|uniref:universal stress protein n=1 Tax=Bosea sp. F3-2 TaxID=2599640 RepID=UPI0011EE94C4|nr:universal stress protein [Bosea sp. F3-2]QEL27181.1 universal stress protein [Bosea sp. F3-2]